jgi:SAM-dependent methyltransferase
MIANPEIERQATYHSALFAGLSQWDDVWKVAIDLIGHPETALGLGLDQLGLFGPRGVSLVIDQIVQAADGRLRHVVELGSGFGGALRQAGRELRARGFQPRLTGVELVGQHCELSRIIGRALDDVGLSVVQADARHLPMQAGSVDAIFASGSASHFDSMAAVLAESYRVLRPGGVVVMTEEVSLQPEDVPGPGDAFVMHHPFVRPATPERRRSEFEAAGLTIGAWRSLTDWAAPLLRQRVQMLRLLSDCAAKMYGPDEYARIVDTLTSASVEYERGSVQPVLVVARRAS